MNLETRNFIFGLWLLSISAILLGLILRDSEGGKLTTINFLLIILAVTGFVLGVKRIIDTL